MTAAKTDFADKNVAVPFKLSGLKSNINYKLWFAATNLDLSPRGMTTQVYEKTFSTGVVPVTPGTFAAIMHTALMTLLGLLFAMFILI